MRTDFLPCLVGTLLVSVAAGLSQPVITNQPQTQAVVPGASITFIVGARGTEPITYRWQRNPGTGFCDLVDCTNAVLTVTNVQPWHAMDYRAVLTNLSGARTSAVAHLYALLPPVLTNRMVIENFDDNQRYGWREVRPGPISETNHQLAVTGYWPGINTTSPPDTIAVAWFDRTWRVANSQCIEWRVDLVDMNPAASAACIEPGNGSDTGYVFMKGRDWIKFNKWINGPSHWLYEKAQLPNSNVILAFALTRASPDTIITGRVLDKSNHNAVLYERSIVDTPGADQTLSRVEQLTLSGMDLESVPDRPAPPLAAGSAVCLDTWQFNDANQPRAAVIFDNFELWTYKVPTVRYVDAASANSMPPYTNWVTAANVIQDAVDAAVPGDVIIVTNGTYATGGRAVGTNLLANRVAVDKPLTLQSVNGPAFTVIQGYQVPGTTNGGGAIRCVYLANGASLSGFTLKDGGTCTNGDFVQELSGGGLWCESTNAVASNCVLTANSAADTGGGAYGGNLNNCTLSNNWSGAWGGGAGGTILNHSTLMANCAGMGGGASSCTLNNCVLTGNLALIAGGAAADGALNDCTLTGNSAGSLGGGAVGSVQATCFLKNCILYYNNAPEDPNFASNPASMTFLSYCCTMPMPDPWQGPGNITNAPLFVDYAGGNLQLQSNSPCINAGNRSYFTDSYFTNCLDLDDNPRIVSRTVDIGAYEFQGSDSIISYAWLQQYGLSTDGPADYADPDQDGMNNWQEWRCQTDPTNALSALRLVSATPAGTNVTVTWQSVTDVNYYLERSTNLASPFLPVASGMRGQSGTSVYTETNAVTVSPLFYRVGVAY